MKHLTLASALLVAALTFGLNAAYANGPNAKGAAIECTEAASKSPATEVAQHCVTDPDCLNKCADEAKSCSGSQSACDQRYKQCRSGCPRKCTPNKG
jgi:hypothetical protein